MNKREEVDALMKKWYNTPTFNLSETPGFEEFKEELQKFEKSAPKLWAVVHAHDELYDVSIEHIAKGLDKLGIKHDLKK